VDAGLASDLGAAEVRVVRLPAARDGTPREALLLRDRHGALRAYLNRCEHLPVPLDAGGRRFLAADGGHLQCQTHGALYRLADGFCVQGPCAGRSLQALAVELEGDAVYVLLDA
jgi:nitrite reductase/ring-hydroxylating ferredoxin subunit